MEYEYVIRWKDRLEMMKSLTGQEYLQFKWDELV